jgi:predicted DNA-binding protein
VSVRKSSIPAGDSARSYESVIVKARVPADEAKRLEAVASENDRTVSAELRRAIRLYLATVDVAA